MYNCQFELRWRRQPFCIQLNSSRSEIRLNPRRLGAKPRMLCCCPCSKALALKRSLLISRKRSRVMALGDIETGDVATGSIISATPSPDKHVLPLAKRRIDWPILLFFVLNLVLITYIVDLEQLVIPDPSHFTYPI